MIEPAADRLDLLLWYGERDGGAAAPEGVSASSLDRVAVDTKARIEPTNFIDGSVDPNLLAVQRWGVIVPDDDALSRSLLDSILPLLRKRVADMGLESVEAFLRRYVYRAPQVLSPTEATAWFKRVIRGLGVQYLLREKQIPAYLLILGDLHQVPESVHRALTGHFVGRLAFSDPDSGAPRLDAYAAYAEKVVAAETRAAAAAATPPESAPRARIVGVPDGSRATSAGLSGLVRPLIDLAQNGVSAELKSGVNGPADSRIRSRDDLWAAGRELPASVLFTLSHGYGADGSGDARLQRRLQGAMSFGRLDERLAAEEIRTTPGSFLDGGVWFMFACFGAGTPSDSHFKDWLRDLAPDDAKGAASALLSLPRSESGGRPFIAALPQELLAREHGPLGFVSHLDLAWTHGFQSDDDALVPEPFLNFIAQLVARKRLGVAFSNLLDALVEVDQSLISIYALRKQSEALGSAETLWTPERQKQFAVTWMRRQDLAGYVILGDPAVQLAAPNAAEKSATPGAAAPVVQPPAPLEVGAAEARPEPQPSATINQPAAAPVPVPAAAPVAAAESAPEAAPIPAPMPAAAAQAPAPISAAPAPAFVQEDGLPLTAEKLELAVSQIIANPGVVRELAKQLGLSRWELEGLVRVYREAGRAALLRRSR